MTHPLMFNPTPGYGPEKIADTFIPNGHPTRPGGHTGWDNRAPSGSPIRPLAPGMVYATPNSGDCGNGVRINHGGWWTSSYCHFAHPTTRRVGDEVGYDTELGRVGQTGNAVYPHLHFSIEYQGVRQDPALLLEGAGWIRDAWVYSGPMVRRIAGTNRWSTAQLFARALREGFDTGTVFVVNGTTFPDALVAATAGLPVLYCDTDWLPPATVDALKFLAPTHIIVVGGPSVVSDTIAGQLKQYEVPV